jgi:hypothetical protein
MSWIFGPKGEEETRERMEEGSLEEVEEKEGGWGVSHSF